MARSFKSGLTTIDGNGNARATANFLSASPRPADGRITILAYALGEESFIDLNGSNVYDAGPGGTPHVAGQVADPFQDLGNIYLDRLFNGVYNANDDQFISTSLSGNTSTCVTFPAYQSLLGLDVSIPSINTTCDGVWGKTYVRRAIETVLSTSDANPHWSPNTTGLGLAAADGHSCPTKDNLIIYPGYDANEVPYTTNFYPLAGTALTDPSKAYSFLVSDANPVRLNPMAAGTLISITTSTGTGAILLGGSPVGSTTEASYASFSYSTTTGGTVTITFTSPSGVATSIGIPVFPSASGTTSCP